jgi:RNA polymerase sigma-70 factor (ECF subfamily)
VALKSGLRDSEAEEVVQETVISVAKKMGKFHYDPKVCSFKGWLMHVAGLRILDQYRKRGPKDQRVPLRASDTSRTSTAERVSDPGGVALEDIWDQEWKENLLDAAMRRIKRKVKPVHYQIFQLRVVQQVAPRKVARMMGTSVAQVYLVQHRLAKLVRRERELLERNREWA